MRFRPPAVAPGPALDWVLAQAFAAAPGDSPPPPGAAELARRLEVAARIGARTAAPELLVDARVAAVAQLQAREAALAVAPLAAGAGIPCCFLKGVALELRGVLPAGGRSIGDVDVLVRRRDARRLVAVLQGAGWARGAGEEYAHHLAPLAHPQLGSLEVHVEIPGVTVQGARRFATFDDLARGGLLEGAASRSGETANLAGAFLSAPPAQLAHLLAHALAQHGFRPDAYPPLRLVADLIDFGVDDEPVEAHVAPAIALVERAVPRAEAEAAIALARDLRQGRVELLGKTSDAGTLLRHLLGAALDDRYREALKLQELAHPLGSGSRWRARARAAWTALALSRRQIDTIYGRPRSGWGYVARRLWRPFDLVRRATRARMAAR